MSHANRRLVFHETGNPRFPFETVVDGETWAVRANEFPEEPFVYSLVIDGEVVEELMAWPSAWTRPEGEASEVTTAPEDAHEEANYERELSRWERVRNTPPSKLVK